MLSDKHRQAILGLPNIENLDDLARSTHLSQKLLYRLSNFSEKQYRAYEVPKKNGSMRLIAQPSSELKAVQAWILRNILDRLTVHSACKGFEAGSSILDNALPHVGAPAIMCLDIEDFFSSVSGGRIWSIFRNLGYNRFVSTTLTSLCTYEGGLPQGSPASPKLANIAVYRLDSRLSGYVGGKGVVYTRYADDLAFSSYSYEKVYSVRTVVEKIVRDEGFVLNYDKTRIMGPARQRRVTGLVLGPETAGIGRQRLRVLRARIHQLTNVQKTVADDTELESLKGWIAFTKGVDQNRYDILKKYVKRLQEKHPQPSISLLL